MCLNLVEYRFQQPLQNNKSAQINKKNRKRTHSAINCVAPPQIWWWRFPISKQQSYNQEWQELTYALMPAKKHLDLHAKQALKLKNQNDYQMVQFLVTFSSTIIS
jgi:hypothetical protein